MDRYKKTKLVIILLLIVLSSIPLVLSYLFPTRVPTLTFIRQTPEEGLPLKAISYISGFVENPGVYEIEDDTRIFDLVNMAGGFSKDADTDFISSQLNLSQLVEDEQHIYIPSSKLVETSPVKQESTGGLIDLNIATMDQLVGLPGIGESTAETIIDARPFSSVQDLLNVKGIGESKFESIEDLVTV